MSEESPRIPLLGMWLACDPTASEIGVGLGRPILGHVWSVDLPLFGVSDYLGGRRRTSFVLEGHAS